MLSRRTVLRLVATAIPTLVVGCNGQSGDGLFDPEEVPESTTLFPRTPMVGDVTSTRAVISVHVADDSPVRLRVWAGQTVVADQPLEPNGDGFHKVILAALFPGESYRYAVFSGEAPAFESRGLIGEFRTAPADDERPVVRFALAGCVGQGTVLPDYYMPPGSPLPTTEPFQWEVFKQAADHDLDAIVHLGDQGYLDFVWSDEDGTVDAYLNAWGWYHGGGYRDLYPLAPLYTTWDDHEATDNGTFDPWDMTPDEATKLDNAQSAWYKIMPIDAMTPADGPVWRGFQWGQTVELLLLDCRYELDEVQLVSEAQLAWLLDRIESSPCRFVCVATPKPFSIISSSTPLGADNAQRWEGFPSDRAEVTDLIDRLDARHVLFVTGDIHMNYLGRVTEAGTSVSEQAYEVCCTSGNINPIASTLSLDQFEFVDNSPHLPVLTFDPDAGTVHVAFYAADGSVSFERTLDDV